jgi:prepilin-type N-terminal cleavage/methylation domain-containing protein
MHDHSLHSSARRGFSLLELLLVIFIISLIYFLGFEGLETPSEESNTTTPLNLKAHIMKDDMFPQKGTLICLNKCTACYFRKDISTPFEAYKGNINLPNLVAYVVDRSDSLKKVDFGRYDDEPICLKINFYLNGSSTQLILQTDKGIYFLPAYFGASQKVNSLEQAQALWLAYDHSLDGEGDFY